MGYRLLADAWPQWDWLRENRLRQIWQRYRTAPDTTLVITDDFVTVKAGVREFRFTLPPAFRADRYLDHIEEMAAWLRPQLQAGHIALKRCDLTPAAKQLYLCQVELPEMAPKEQRSWLHWEAARYVPFEPGSFVAVLLPGCEPGKKTVFLAAVLRERLDAWRQLIRLLGGKLRKIAFFGPEGACLEADFSPEGAPGKRMVHYLYRGLTLLCFLTTLFLLLQGLWQRQQVQQALLKAEQGLVPFNTLQEAYRQSKKTEREVRSLQDALAGIETETVVWHVLLRTLGEAIPSGCWLDKVVQKPGSSGLITLQGRALELQRVLIFKEQLEKTDRFSSVLLSESSGREVAVTSGAADPTAVLHELPHREPGIRFVLELVLRSSLREVTQ